MDGVHSDSSIPHNSESKSENDPNCTTLDETIRDKRIPLSQSISSRSSNSASSGVSKGLDTITDSKIESVDSGKAELDELKIENALNQIITESLKSTKQNDNRNLQVMVHPRSNNFYDNNTALNFNRSETFKQNETVFLDLNRMADDNDDAQLPYFEGSFFQNLLNSSSQPSLEYNILSENDSHSSVTNSKINQQYIFRELSATDEVQLDNIEYLENIILKDYHDNERNKQFIDSCINSGNITEKTKLKKEGPKYPFMQQSSLTKRDFSNVSNLRFPSKNGAYWMPNLKPLAEFLDFTLKEEEYKISEEERIVIKKIDSILAQKFCLRAFNIITLIMMFSVSLVSILVTILYIYGKLSRKFELIHALFLNSVIVFLLFGINSCASREVRIDGKCTIKSFIMIYWHLLRKRFDKSFNESYLFIDDWYGDNKYKFIRAKLQEISLVKNELNEITESKYEINSDSS